MTRKTQTLKKVKSQKKSKSQLRKTRKVRKHKVGGTPDSAARKFEKAKRTLASFGIFRNPR